MIVVDAGVWVRALVDSSDVGAACRRSLIEDHSWLVPAHGPIEVLRTIRRYETADLISADQADAFAAEVAASQFQSTGPEPWLLDEVWALRRNVSPYDAPYVALARRYGVALLTLDGRLARAARQLHLEVREPA